MINEIININVDYEAMGVKPSPRQTTLTTYILDHRNILSSEAKKRPAVIVCPGGGYGGTSEREAEPIAMAYCAAGFHAFVLDYSIVPSAWPAQATELSKAVMYVREIAEKHNIDPDKIFVCGFSAGGHLAASLGVHWNHPDIIRFSGAKNGNNKPDGVILGYPVITSNAAYKHSGTIQNFVAGREDVLPLASLENFVTAETPQMFIWHTFSDNMVPVANSLLMADALNKNSVKFELHIYPEGVHGLSLSNWTVSDWPGGIVPAVQNWVEMSVRWINDFMHE